MESIISALGEFDATSNKPKIKNVLLGNTGLNKTYKLDKLYINFNKIYKLPELDPVTNEISSDYEILCNRELDKINFANTVPEGHSVNYADYIVKSVYYSATDSNIDFYYKLPKFEPTTEQQAALDSGITANKVATYDAVIPEVKKYYKHTMQISNGGSEKYSAVLSDISSISTEYTLDTIPDGVYPLMDEPTT